MSIDKPQHWPMPNGHGRENGQAAAPSHSLGWKIWLIVKTIQARLRFIVILAVMGGVIAYWDTFKAYYERWTRPAVEQQVAASDTEFFCPMHPQIIRDNSKEKCPICFMPLSKRKKGEAGDVVLPPGVVSRVQLSPYRMVLAGVQTSEVTYQRLAKEIKTVGFVEFDERRLARISVRVSGRSRIDKLFVNVTGQTVRKGSPLAVLYSPDLVTTAQNLLDARRSGNQDLERLARDRLQLWGIDGSQIDDILRTGKGLTQVTIYSPIGGHIIRKYQTEGEYVEEGARLFDVADLSTVWLQAQVYEDESGLLQEGMAASATTLAAPEREFTGRLSFIHPHLDQSTRTLTVRFDMDNPEHELRPGMYATIKLSVPPAKLGMFATALNERWRDKTLVNGIARTLAAGPGGMPELAVEELVEASLNYFTLKQGLLLAVPDSAVIDTGSRKIVYRQETPGVYEGVQVHLGPRMTGTDDGTVYPVLRGLEAGDRVVTNGTFLIDAETRLNPAAGSIYYGGSGGKGSAGAAMTRPTTPADEDLDVRAVRAKLKPADRKIVEAQEFCPVLTGNRLGSMGVPVRLLIRGQPVFLCCKGCLDKASANPDGTLAEVARLKAGAKNQLTQEVSEKTSTSVALPSVSTPEEEKEIKVALAELSPKDRLLAEAQRFCVVREKSRLGSMGAPVKLMIAGQPVFLCCEGCEKKALANSSQSLERAEKLRGKPAGRK